MIKKGVWLYGFSGSGKSYLAEIIKKKIKSCFLIDGDVVRSTLSKDLDYSRKSRKIQIERIFNISKICILNNFFPVASTVFMDKSTLNKCKKNLIAVIKVERLDFEKIKLRHKTYKNKKNVVGKDIRLPNLNTYIFKNSGDEKIWKNINLLIKFLKKKDF